MRRIPALPAPTVYRRFEFDPEGPDRLVYVLQLAQSNRSQLERKLLADFAGDLGRYPDAARAGQLLQPGGDVDPFAVAAIVFDDYERELSRGQANIRNGPNQELRRRETKVRRWHLCAGLRAKAGFNLEADIRRTPMQTANSAFMSTRPSHVNLKFAA